MSDRRKMATQSRRDLLRGGRPAADPVVERLDRIEAVLQNLTPEPLSVSEEFIVGQLEQVRLMQEALAETAARLEGELAELRQGKGG